MRLAALAFSTSFLVSAVRFKPAQADCSQQQQEYEEFHRYCDISAGASTAMSWNPFVGLGIGLVAMNQCRIRDEKLNGLNSCKRGEAEAAARNAQAEAERRKKAEAEEQLQREETAKEEQRAADSERRAKKASRIQQAFEERAKALRDDVSREMDVFLSGLDPIAPDSADHLVKKQAEIDGKLTEQLDALELERRLELSKLD